MHAQLDPRGPRFNAALTSAVLVIVLLFAPSPVGVGLLGLQTVLFALGAFRGVQRTPAAYLFRTLVRPRLGAPQHLEDPAPPRFAQAVGLGFAALGLVGYLSGATLLGAIAVGFALVAALLNATTGFCLGCEVYLLARRLVPTSTSPATSRPTTSRPTTSRPTTSNRGTQKKELVP